MSGGEVFQLINTGLGLVAGVIVLVLMGRGVGKVEQLKRHPPRIIEPDPAARVPFTVTPAARLCPRCSCETKRAAAFCHRCGTRVGGTITPSLINELTEAINKL